MEPKNKDNKQHKHAFLIYFLIVVLGVCLLYSTTVTTIPTPYKPTNSSSDPVLLALHTSISQLQHISSLPQTLISESKDPQSKDSLRTCENLLKCAETYLNKSISLLNEGPEDNPVFTETLDEWITSSILSQRACGLFYLEERMGSQVLDDEQFGVRLKRLKQCINNSMAVLEKIHPLLEKFRFRACLFNYICVTI